MNLAVLHYHLNRGGVTRVIENQLASLDAVRDGAPDAGDPLRVALLFGGRRDGFDEELPHRLKTFRLSTVEVPMLDYDNARPHGEHESPDDLAAQLTAALDRLHFDPQKPVLHLHNHSLGKNRLLTPVVGRLADAGYAILLQIHDFAEDFRAANYQQIGTEAGASLYPQAEGIHYAVLNRRDQKILREADIDPTRLHLLPNPVPKPVDLPSKSEARARLHERFGIDPQERFVLYPVRGIRRKNVGEALLYSALAPAGTTIGLTLGPLNPAELSIYTMWKELAAELRLPCRFGLSSPGALSFAENLAGADLILTTSVAEGFGMVFLESWLAGRPLIGRDLPEITADFVAAGVRLDWLRAQLRVPVDWVSADGDPAEVFRRTVAEAYRRDMGSFGRELSTHWQRDLDAKINAGMVDFGDLDEPMQRQVLQTVCRDSQSRRRVLHDNSWLGEALTLKAGDVSEVIESNRQTIDRHFSLVPSGRRLQELYRKVAGSHRGRRSECLPHAGRILDRFLELERFRLIRS